MTDTRARILAALIVLLVLAIGPVLIACGYVAAGWVVLGVVALAACVAAMCEVADARRRGLR